MRFGSQKRWHRQFVLADQLHRHFSVLVSEGQRARQHFEHEDSEAPPVADVVVARPFDHFGRHVFHGAAERAGFVLVVGVLE